MAKPVKGIINEKSNSSTGNSHNVVPDRYKELNWITFNCSKNCVGTEKIKTVIKTAKKMNLLFFVNCSFGKKNNTTGISNRKALISK